MMGEFYVFRDEDGVLCRVEFEIVDEEHSLRRYGLRASIFRDGILKDRKAARERFLTRKEAEETAKMLCRFQVTPCTLCDII